MQIIEGNYYFPQSNKFEQVQLHITDEALSLFNNHQCLMTCLSSQAEFSPSIPGIPIQINFDDGGKFVAIDNNQRIHESKSNLEFLEKNKPLIIASIFLIPALMWFILTIAMPRMAEESVTLLPQSVSNEMGEQSFEIINKLFLEPSVLPVERQNAVKLQWQQALKELSLDETRYQLHVYASEYFGPNAFALPNGTVVITDDLIKRLDDNPDAILAVLLHEIGHVERKHSLRIVAQSVSNTIAIAVIFGDIEGIGEVIIGTGSTLVLNAFSREMESEADDYALEKLIQLGKSPTAFSDAMKTFLDLKSEHESGDLLKYLSSHPEIKDRIKKAEEFGL